MWGGLGGWTNVNRNESFCLGAESNKKLFLSRENMRGTYYTRRLCLTLDNLVYGVRYTFVTRSLPSRHDAFFPCDLPADRVSPCLPVVIQIDVVEDVYMPPVNVP